jgi:hypothetical protein
MMIEGFAERVLDLGPVQYAYSESPANGPTLLLVHGVTGR